MADVLRDVTLLTQWLGKYAKEQATALAVTHDDWCPSVRSQLAGDCICRPTYHVMAKIKQKVKRGA